MSALPSIITPALLSTIRTYPHLPHHAAHAWYLIAATTLAVLNRPDEITTVYRATKERRMREALVKAGAIGGLPKEVTPRELQDEPLAYSPTSRPAEIYDFPFSQIFRRGQAFFEMIYGKVSKRVMGQMDRSGTEARLMCGYILSNTNVLTAAETSFVLIAGLIPQDVNPQLKGHLRGTLNGGATVEEVMAVRDVAIKIYEASGMKTIGSDVPAGWGWRGEVASL